MCLLGLCNSAPMVYGSRPRLSRVCSAPEAEIPAVHVGGHLYFWWRQGSPISCSFWSDDSKLQDPSRGLPLRNAGSCACFHPTNHCTTNILAHLLLAAHSNRSGFIVLLTLLLLLCLLVHSAQHARSGLKQPNPAEEMASAGFGRGTQSPSAASPRPLSFRLGHSPS